MLLDVRLLTVKDYHRMTEAGIFDPDERVELLAGQIIKMAAKGTAHESAITRTERLLRNLLGEQILLRLQSPIQLDDYSEPEPDVAVVRVDQLDYEDHHPTRDEVYLIIEVADTSLSRDLEFKAGIYAQSGISDYWVLDVNNRKLHVFREPSQNGYQRQMILSENASVSLLAFPDVTVVVKEMLRPAIAP
jgi:Uma2 family endonuclease